MNLNRTIEEWKTKTLDIRVEEEFIDALIQEREQLLHIIRAAHADIEACQTKEGTWFGDFSVQDLGNNRADIYWPNLEYHLTAFKHRLMREDPK